MLLRPFTFGHGALFTIAATFLLGTRHSSIARYMEHHDTVSTATAVSSKPCSIEPFVTNATLGFEKILAIGLAERSDRRDILSLTAAINDIQLEWIDAVKGTEMNRKAWPAHWNTGKINRTMAELGNWRSHVNALRRAMEAGWSTTLIIEDDADWDIALRDQLQTFANRTRTLNNAGRNESLWVTSETPTHSPYGDDWDLLWLGNCAVPTAPDDAQTFSGEGSGDSSQMHYVFPVRGGMSCLYGYAVNPRSVRTLMGWLLDVDESTDFAASRYCECFRCIAVWPELIGSHKPAGPHSKDSSISETDDGWRDQGESRNIGNSAVLDMIQKMGHKGPWAG